jgi:hypothetical protein
MGTMQRSVLEKEREGEKDKVDSVAEVIKAVTQNGKLEIETFKLTTEKIENGVSIDFEMRAYVNFKDRSKLSE